MPTTIVLLTATPAKPPAGEVQRRPGRLPPFGFPPDDKQLLAGTDMGLLALWDVGTRTLRGTMAAHTGSIRAIDRRGRLPSGLLWPAGPWTESKASSYRPFA
jgi:hypothetical protein